MSDLSFTTPAAAIVRHANDQSRVDAMTGGVMREIVFVSLSGTGEAVANVNFASVFIEKPTFSFGGELGPAQPVISGQFPTVSAVVRNWGFQIRSYTGDRLYTGAAVLIVTTGVDVQKMVVHLQFEGMGLVSPV